MVVFCFLSELKTCFEQLNIEKECRVIVLTGSGRAFSTGKCHTCQSWKLNSTIQVKVRGGLEGWGEGVLGGKGMKQGRGRKNRRACIIPPHHPPPFKILRVRGVVDYTCSSVLSSSSLFHPLNPLTPLPFKISPYLHLNNWIIE